MSSSGPVVGVTVTIDAIVDGMDTDMPELIKGRSTATPVTVGVILIRTRAMSDGRSAKEIDHGRQVSG